MFADVFFEVIVKKLLNYFTKSEIILWISSVLLIVVSFLIFDRENYLTLFASLIGITAIIFCAKGNPFGQVLMIIFSTFYAVISYSFAYYGEMLTYLGMTLPMAVFGLISWLRNPYQGNKKEVKVKNVTKTEISKIFIAAIFVSFIFYFILKYFNTANLIPSTLSVTTSFIAASFSYLRSPYFALAYASNDIVLILLWVLASFKDISYLSVIICFVVFLVNDLYGFISWLRMMKRQEKAIKSLLKY